MLSVYQFRGRGLMSNARLALIIELAPQSVPSVFKPAQRQDTGRPVSTYPPLNALGCRCRSVCCTLAEKVWNFVELNVEAPFTAGSLERWVGRPVFTTPLTMQVHRTLQCIAGGRARRPRARVTCRHPKYEWQSQLWRA